jgi:Mrp family chromosome partitioning ATPase
MLGVGSGEPVPTGADGLLKPVPAADGLLIAGVDAAMEDREDAVHLARPMKSHGDQRPGLRESIWGTLDFLLLDSPPGFGRRAAYRMQSIPELTERSS